MEKGRVLEAGAGSIKCKNVDKYLVISGKMLYYANKKPPDCVPEGSFKRDIVLYIFNCPIYR